MSALGHERLYRPWPATSALAPISTEPQTSHRVSDVPESEITTILGLLANGSIERMLLLRSDVECEASLRCDFVATIRPNPPGTVLKEKTLGPLQGFSPGVRA
jgi:hypothetical protein